MITQAHRIFISSGSFASTAVDKSSGIVAASTGTSGTFHMTSQPSLPPHGSQLWKQANIPTCVHILTREDI